MNTVGFIGLGNMGRAILRGLTCNIHCYDPLYDKNTVDSEVEIAQKCKYIVLAVKPQSVKEVLQKIAPALTQESILISICAGISTEYIRSVVGKKLSIVRVMPNMPVMLGEGASAVSFCGDFSEDETAFILEIIGSSSPAVEVIPADKMNEIICINGSSPAFIYLLAKYFTDYAVTQGIEHQAALNLFSQSLIGAGKMLKSSEASIEELIAQVSSKGGTTIAGLEQLRGKGLQEAVNAACEACTSRAYELGENF
jgi:pyrroline-5-carboxylate reductase